MHRRGAQRSFYFLSLPYRYSVPLLLSYTILHWQVSQALFYVRVNLYDGKSNTFPRLTSTHIGGHQLLLICAIIVGSLTVITLLGPSVKPFRSVIPLAGSCSAGISAACHPPEYDVDAATEHIIWGQICLPGQRNPSTNSLSPLLGAG